MKDMTIIHETVEGDIQVVGVVGRLDQELTPGLEQTLVQLLDQGHSRLIVDMAQTNYVNSGGLRCLVSAWRRARGAGGDVLLCEMVPRVSQVFAIVGFDRVFHIYDSCAAARQHWQPD